MFYENGNTSVTLLEDGTKIREWEGEASPVFPESIDLKITDYCDAGCAYCHEQSTKRGTHAAYADIMAIVDCLPAGVELAIGGGNPLAHTELFRILREFKSRGIVANLTVNAVHLRPFRRVIDMIRREQLIGGLGVSYRPAHIADIKAIRDKNTVLHVIAGVHDIDEIRTVAECLPHKMLVLGYKQFGFGLKFYKPEVEQNIARWRYWIGTLMRSGQFHVSFDNLGLSQLDIKQIVKPDAWESCYMGDDGTFTMYADAVTMTYAATSTGRRIPIHGKTIREMFEDIRHA